MSKFKIQIIFQHYNDNGLIHCSHGPAFGYRKGGIYYKEWWYNGKNYTNDVINWMQKHFKTIKKMEDIDYDIMWLEIL